MSTTTESTTHATGPWQANTFAIYSASRELVAHVGGTMHPIGRRVEEQLANARLIAAAPDLLSATRKLLNAIKALGLEPADGNCRSIVEQAEQAIAKAEGQ